MTTTFGKIAPDPPQPLHLTPRQLDVLALLCEGLPNQVIGRRLNIAATTVKVHVSNILRELKVSSRLQALLAAHRLELIAPSSVASPASQAVRFPDPSNAFRQGGGTALAPCRPIPPPRRAELSEGQDA